MDLQGIRKKLVELSGLYSLVTDYTGGDYSDNGADFFIQEGQKWLDGLLDTPQAPVDYKVSLSAGDYFKTVSDARSIEDVRIEVSGEGVKYLEKLSIGELHRKYADEQLLANADKDEPAHWALGTTREIATDGSYSGQTGKKLFILPPADVAYDVVVTGLFFSMKLEADDDENWWSQAYPGILIQGALYFRETFLRNTQGMNDWRNAIIDSVNKIDMDMVEEQIANIDQMKDAWNVREHIMRRKYNE